MAAPPQKPQAAWVPEDDRDRLYREGTQVRQTALALLVFVQGQQITLREAFLRRDLSELGDSYQRLFQQYLEFENRVSDFLQKVATTRQMRTQAGLEPVSLNLLLTFSVYTSQLSTHRDSLRSLVHEVGEVLSSKRGQANTLAAISVALVSLLVSLVSLLS